METPEKIYLQEPTKVPTQKVYDNDIEYTRTDAFIEKAVEYLKDHKMDVETEDNGIAGWISDYFIEDFKNYMKGE